jgi:hypothetical protein
MSLYRILTVPLEICCRHAEDEPTLAELVQWLQAGGLEANLNTEGCPSPVAGFVEHLCIDWVGVVESLGRRRSPRAHRNEGDDQNL